MGLLTLAWVVGQLAGPVADGRTITVEGRDAKAVAASVARARPGDTVRLPAGTFRIAEPVELKPGIRLIGAGQESTVLRYTGEKPGAVLLARGCEDVEIANLTVDGAKNPLARQGIYAVDSRHLGIHHVTVRDFVKGQGFGPHGIHFNGHNPTRTRGVTDSVVADCRIENIGIGATFGSGIRVSWGSSRNRILRNVVRNTGRGGIFGDNGSVELAIRGNTVSGSGGTGLGIEVWGGCDRSVIEDNRIDHWLSVGGCDFCAVRRNVVASTDGTSKPYGLEIIGSHCVVTDNVVDASQGIGISVSGKQPKQYHFYGHNTIRHCYHWGAQLQGEAGGIAYYYFYRCHFLDTLVGHKAVKYKGHEGNGFRTNGNVEHVVLEECEMRGNGRHGIQLGGPNVDSLRFLRSVIADNAGAAVVGPRDYTHLEWTDCTVEGNKGNALPPAKPGPGPLPIAGFNAPAVARVGQNVRFAATTKAVAATLWDLGDGPPVVGREVTHAYTRPGEYRVTLVIWDRSGAGARAEKTLRIGPTGPECKASGKARSARRNLGEISARRECAVRAASLSLASRTVVTEDRQAAVFSSSIAISCQKRSQAARSK